MMRVSKFYDKKPVIKDISLSYFYGAKIGVLGLNGSGKSSLLRIMAGVDAGRSPACPCDRGRSSDNPMRQVSKPRRVLPNGIGRVLALATDEHKLDEG